MTDKPEREVRFAVVMYGGVSLAIYINGVTQELYSLVRATAGSRGKDEVKGVEAVYRKLGEHLKSRFVVDILSGTSAGGINAVYLAKAFANDQPIGQLKELWINEGDIGLLVNDRESVAGLDGLRAAEKPASLLNSQRMYYKLLYALQGMEHASGSSTPGAALPPYVDELDLFITATDLQGLATPLPLARGEPAKEYRFRTVFHFNYSASDAAGGSNNDFEKQNDPFLAFAARCTSSFPFAFEPMRLEDIREVLNTRQFKDYEYLPAKWRRFCGEYDAAAFPALSFADGGYLDNKPFSYATSTLLRRRADLPVDRKLVYIEPAPERIHEPAGEKPEPPDAIANVMAALLTLPRYETIREDLETVVVRNNVIRRINHIVQNIESIFTLGKISLDSWQVSAEWRSKFMDEVIRTYGAGYPAYHQLRVEEVLEDLTGMLARALGWDEQGTQARRLSALLHQWRKSCYKTSSKEADGAAERRSENELLFRLDMPWRMRRLYYLRQLIDVLLNDLGNGKFAGKAGRARSILLHSQTKWPVNEKNVEDYRQALDWVKRRVNQAYADLRGRGRAMRSRNLAGAAIDPKSNLLGYVEALKELKASLESRGRDGVTPTRLEELMRFASSKAEGLPLSETEEQDYQDMLRRLEQLTLALASREQTPKHKGPLREAFSLASSQVQQALLRSDEEANLSPKVRTALKQVRKCLNFYYGRFEYFDMLTFPIMYGTDTGESDEVEIIRISPEDADSLVKKEHSHTKLLGTKLGNFGAFFNRQWRENDMLWGRLDGAECLIKALLPDERDIPMRAEFIREAHLAILEEHLSAKDQLSTFQARYAFSDITPQDLRQAVMRTTGDKSKLIENFKAGYRVEQDFPPEETLKVMARMTRVLSRLLGNLAEKHPALSSPASMLSRFGQIFFGILQAALPRSLPGLLFRNLIGWAYLVELALLFGGKIFNNTDIANFGFLALLLTAALHFAVLSLRNIILKKWTSGRLLQALALCIGLVAALGAGVLIYSGLVYLEAIPAPGGLAGSLLDLLREILK